MKILIPLLSIAAFCAAPAAAGNDPLDLRLSDMKQIAVPAPARPALKNEESGPMLITKAVPAAPGFRAAVVARFKLESMRNEYLNTDAAFLTEKKTRVAVAGTSAANCVPEAHDCDDTNSLYMILSAGGKIYGANAYKMATAGEKTITLPGEAPLTVSVSANIFTPIRSTVKVTQNGKTLLKNTAEELAKAVYNKGEKVSLSKTYAVIFGTNILEDASLNVHFADKKQAFLGFMPSDDMTKSNKIPLESITEAGVSFPNFESAYTFRKTADGYLEILR